MTKPLPERLREAAGRLKDDVGYGYEVCELASAAGVVCNARTKEDCECQYDCAMRSFKAIADRIESDYIERPRFASDEVAESLYSIYKYILSYDRVITEAYMKDRAVNLQDLSGCITISIDFEVFAKQDTIEAIEADADLSVDEYFKKHNGVVHNHKAVAKDLLRRQRELLEGQR